MIDYNPLYNALIEAKAESWAEILPQQLAAAFDTTKHGSLNEWHNIIDNLPLLITNHRVLSTDSIHIGEKNQLSLEDQANLKIQQKYQP